MHRKQRTITDRIHQGEVGGHINVLRMPAITAVRIPGFLESDEGSVLQRLCNSFCERDGEAVVEACGNIVFRAMETDVRPHTRPLV